MPPATLVFSGEAKAGLPPARQSSSADKLERKHGLMQARRHAGTQAREHASTQSCKYEDTHLRTYARKHY
eukprot:13887537-Alexandrium_andersonii.AAC.1